MCLFEILIVFKQFWFTICWTINIKLTHSKGFGFIWKIYYFINWNSCMCMHSNQNCIEILHKNDKTIRIRAKLKDISFCIKIQFVQNFKYHGNKCFVFKKNYCKIMEYFNHSCYFLWHIIKLIYIHTNVICWNKSQFHFVYIFIAHQKCLYFYSESIFQLMMAQILNKQCKTTYILVYLQNLFWFLIFT